LIELLCRNFKKYYFGTKKNKKYYFGTKKQQKNKNTSVEKRKKMFNNEYFSIKKLKKNQ